MAVTPGPYPKPGELEKAFSNRLPDKNSELLEAARKLRIAQRDYMANRGNEEKGRAVANAAAVLDIAIEHADVLARNSVFHPYCHRCEKPAPSSGGCNQADCGIRCLPSAETTVPIHPLAKAVRWVLNDAYYKAPEQIGMVAERWIDKLREAMEQEGKPAAAASLVDAALSSDPCIVLTYAGLLIEDDSPLLNDAEWLKGALGSKDEGYDSPSYGMPLLRLGIQNNLTDQDAIDYIKRRRMPNAALSTDERTKADLRLLNAIVALVDEDAGRITRLGLKEYACGWCGKRKHFPRERPPISMIEALPPHGERK